MTGATLTFSPGDAALVLVSRGWHGHVVREAVVDRVTKTQYVLRDGRRFRRTDLREVGASSSYYPDDVLIATDDPRVSEIRQKEERDNLVSAVRLAFDGWNRVRDRGSDKLVALRDAAQALIDFDKAAR